MDGGACKIIADRLQQNLAPAPGNGYVAVGGDPWNKVRPDSDDAGVRDGEPRAPRAGIVKHAAVVAGPVREVVALLGVLRADGNDLASLEHPSARPARYFEV